jgi:hypothetical protein
MPTPSDHPTSIAEVISTRSCPPEVDRIPAWEDESVEIDTQDALEDVLSPASATAPSVQSRSDDGTALLATDPLRVERKTADEDTRPPRSTSPMESCSRSQSPVTPPNSSLLRYEFSNVRVCFRLPRSYSLSPIG